MTTLKEAAPCPFCGSSEGLDYRDGSTHRWGVASCVSCGASSGETRREYPDVGEWHYAAMTQWNTRSALAQQGEPVAYEFRMRADWVQEWGLWSPCNKEQHAMYIRAPKLHDWHYETRALYTAAPAPVAQPAQGELEK